MSGTWLATLEDRASRVLPDVFYEYFRQGAAGSITADEAVASWARYRILPRVFSDVREVSPAGSFLGVPAAGPWGVAPTTLQRSADPDGEVAMAAGCAASAVPLVLSSNASVPFAEVASTGAHWWLQAYLPQDRTLAVPMLEAAVAAGASAVVLTVDTPVVAAKYDGGAASALTQVPVDWLRVNLGSAADAPKAQDLGPDDIGWLQVRTGLPVVVKGILHPEDARTAVEAGAAAIWVSNHGGRQLDRVMSTADCLPAVVEAVDGVVEVYVDGGVRDPISALTALAMGADGVFLGRSPLYALALDSSRGVERLFSEFRTGFEEALRIAGCVDLSAVRGLQMKRI